MDLHGIILYSSLKIKDPLKSTDYYLDEYNIFYQILKLEKPSLFSMLDNDTMSLRSLVTSASANSPTMDNNDTLALVEHQDQQEDDQQKVEQLGEGDLTHTNQNDGKQLEDDIFLKNDEKDDVTNNENTGKQQSSQIEIEYESNVVTKEKGQDDKKQRKSTVNTYVKEKDDTKVNWISKL